MGQSCGALWIGQNQLLFEVLGSDFIQRTGRNPGGNAQFLRLGEDFFVLQAEFFRYIVNTDGHNSLTLRALLAVQPS
jgi:hypothetical protein